MKMEPMILEIDGSRSLRIKYGDADFRVQASSETGSEARESKTFKWDHSDGRHYRIQVQISQPKAPADKR